jgi:hypothetical protein
MAARARPAYSYRIRRNEPDGGDAEYDALINRPRALTEAEILQLLTIIDEERIGDQERSTGL